MKTKLTLLTLLTLLTFVGVGCLSKSVPRQSIGASHFGRLVGGPVIESPITGGWVRPHPGAFWWDNIEKEKGQTYDWSEADREVSYWQERDQAILATIWPYAQWDQDACHPKDKKVKHPFGDEMIKMYSICHVEPFQNWVRAMAERYDGDGIDDMPGLKYPITHWEIGNEPDLQTKDLTFFQSGAGAYAEIFRLAFDEIKAASPNAKVLFAGMSGMEMSSINYWRGVFFTERTRGDIGNIHSISASDQFFTKEYNDFWKGVGRDTQSFWVTEALVGSLDVNWDEDMKAQKTFIGYVSAFANGAEKVFDVGKNDPTGGPGEKAEQTFELLIKTIDGFDTVERLSEHAVKFTIGKKTVFALWNGASVPEEIKGKVEVIYYNGTKNRMNVSEVDTTKPLFIIP
ncbi:hypothetical protein HYV69_02855 [Candidatus Uhrbacteria bacterium]|nr:hypothetical protein [Candidatus Uhrbacteria bacterium]